MDGLATPRLIERLLQQKQTGLYFKNGAEWTPNRQEAKRFEDLLSVCEMCYDYGLREVRLVLKDLLADFEVQLDLDTN